jgi:hypothetical protein
MARNVKHIIDLIVSVPTLGALSNEDESSANDRVAEIGVFGAKELAGVATSES